MGKQILHVANGLSRASITVDGQPPTVNQHPAGRGSAGEATPLYWRPVDRGLRITSYVLFNRPPMTQKSRPAHLTATMRAEPVLSSTGSDKPAVPRPTLSRLS